MKLDVVVDMNDLDLQECFRKQLFTRSGFLLAQEEAEQ